MLKNSDMEVLKAFELAFGITPFTLMCQVYSGDILEIKVKFEKVPDSRGVLSDVKTEGVIGYKKGLDEVLAEQLKPASPAA